ncbi:MAG: hypothetical protein JW915_24185 [Chitinispirillaceae bacterium]|nr:hypothetical protein [Chitinispirillaceae bacterium]
MKLLLNARSDIELSNKLGKFSSYVFQQKKRNSVDLDLILEFFKDVDFNWLLTGDFDKKRLIAELDEQTGRKIVDLNKDFEILKNENKRLRDEISLFRNILKEKSSNYGDKNKEG